jgi:hypothetical protein
MKDAMYNGIKEDLVKNRFHPKNIPKFRDWGWMDLKIMKMNE